MSPDRSYVEQNNRERERLRGMVERLGDEALRGMVNEHWTVAGVLGHIAFWDGRVLALADKLERGVPFSPSDDEPEDVDWINDSARPLIHAIPPREVAQLALRLAEETDRRVASLEPDRMFPHNPNSPVNPLRAAHRGEHLDEIEAALGAGGVSDRDPGATAREIIDANLYMVLGTADEAGRPWASPVYYAVEGYRDFYWVSSPHATHSRNIAARSQVSMVVFDSRVPIGSGQGVYMSAAAEEVTGTDLERGIEVFSRRSLSHGGRAWSLDDVEGGAPLRLYRATASEHSVLAKDGRPDHRIPVDVS
jgi:hypothetical protein